MSGVHLIAWRHGRTSYNMAGRLQGQVDIPMDEVGQWQARTAAAAILADHDVTHVLSSDLGRARETAEYLARAVGLEIVTDPRFRERGFGIWEGLPGTEIAARWPNEYRLWRAGGDPQGVGAEPRAVVGERYAAAVGEHTQDLTSGTIVVVSHGTASSAGVRELLGLDREFHGFIGMRNAHWASLVRQEAGPIWRMLGYNLGPNHASSNWDAGPDNTETDDAATRDPD